jgi:hypothetical protein
MRRFGLLPCLLAVLLAVLAAACATMKPAPAYPLYAKLGQGPGPDKVSLLHGPIATVDGAVVSDKGMTFELLPGCHVVTLQRNVGQGNDSGSWAVNLPRITYAFEMKPGHSYSIRAERQDASGPKFWVWMVARETRPDGRTLRWPSVRGASDIDDCHHWAAAQGL